VLPATQRPAFTAALRFLRGSKRKPQPFDCGSACVIVIVIVSLSTVPSCQRQIRQ
jgi:hypothetical protein